MIIKTSFFQYLRSLFSMPLSRAGRRQRARCVRSQRRTSFGRTDALENRVMLSGTAFSDGTVASLAKIDDSTANGPALANFDNFGSSVVSIGDLDGDGVTDLAVGAYRDDTNGTKSWSGAYLLYEYQWQRKINHQDCR